MVVADSTGYIYTSTDSGVTWTEQTGAGSRVWWGVSFSSDGTKIAAAGARGSNPVTRLLIVYL